MIFNRWTLSWQSKENSLALLVNRPEALAVYQHASRALQSQCRKSIIFSVRNVLPS